MLETLRIRGYGDRIHRENLVGAVNQQERLMRKSGQMKPCSICGTEVYRKAWKLRDRPTVYCSRACYEVWWKANLPVYKSGADTYNWKGGDIKKVCLTCEKVFHVGRNHMAEGRKYCSVKCSGMAHSGLNSPSWKGGISSERTKVVNTDEYRNWRKAVYARDHYRCILCLRHMRSFHAHHIKRFVDYPELRLNVDNGVTLCERCHRQVHMMEPEFEPILRSRILRDFTSDTRLPLDVVKIKSELRSDVKRLAEMSSPAA